ncbi:MAG: glucokinase [Waterburya sp.]
MNLQRDRKILAGDLGGTNCRLAIFDGNFSLVAQKSYKCRDYSSLEPMVRDFLGHESYTLDFACIDVPAPVHEGESQLIDLPWHVKATSLAEITRCSVTLLNDIEAAAYGLNTLKDEEIVTIKNGRTIPGGNRAVIAVGTGLGEALVIEVDGQSRVIASEGGHSDFGAFDELQSGLLRYIQQQYQRVSYDMILGGLGLVQIYNYLIASGYGVTPPWLSQKINQGEAAAAIGQAGVNNECEVCAKAIDLFVAILAAEAGNVALRFLARGGIYIGGGIPPRIINKLMQPLFIEHFINKDKITHLLEDIPVYVVLNDQMALQGSAWYALQNILGVSHF